ncbi:class I SAM-dependent methyltransferase [Salinibacterium sp. M195]|uniref:class I SAM-dependent methyltransferase n=1 Tax=Salinibacterium sp. M195 TaxID=2583374 RepID=UPI001C6334FD|nr:class I SAM-dependent methyltransferase [Salinibacterium sp. M195]QYH35543.1 class I SAM-dependent methyltransferase [Salinibacterium sp. M195]
MTSNAATEKRKPSAPSWNTYKESIGDRSGLFQGLVAIWPVTSALNVGSYLDLSPSTGIPAVTYVDTDRRAARFFANHELVASELKDLALPGAAAEIAFLPADFTAPLELSDNSFDLLIALYTGPAWDHCARYLKPGGLFLANSSHGDASLAALDPRATLVGAIHQRDGRYRIDRDNLADYLIPKKPEAADAELIRSSGRGVAYTKPAFAYVFQLQR